MDRGAWRATVHGVAKSWTGTAEHIRMHQSLLTSSPLAFNGLAEESGSEQQGAL